MRLLHRAMLGGKCVVEAAFVTSAFDGSRVGINLRELRIDFRLLTLAT
jgi:hypothetical protein